MKGVLANEEGILNLCKGKEYSRRAYFGANILLTTSNGELRNTYFFHVDSLDKSKIHLRSERINFSPDEVIMDHMGKGEEFDSEELTAYVESIMDYIYSLNITNFSGIVSDILRNKGFQYSLIFRNGKIVEYVSGSEYINSKEFNKHYKHLEGNWYVRR